MRKNLDTLKRDERKITLDEAIELGAVDGLFWCYYFLPETFSLDPPDWQLEFWENFDDPSKRYLCYEVYRDGGKTSTFRAALLRGICYSLYRTGLILSESSTHSKRTIAWVRSKITTSQRLKNAFQLTLGAIDNTGELHIHNGALATKTVLIAQGIEGQIRGINDNDARPDFILADDISSYESTQTEEAQIRVKDIFFGAVLNSLTAEVQNPHSKLALIGTLAGPADVISAAKADSQFFCKTHSVFNESGESTWKAKWSTAQLLRDKQSAEERGQLPSWYREKESKYVAGESSAFKPEFLNFYVSRPESVHWLMGVDPVPPPSDKEIKEGLRKKDWEVFSIVGLEGTRIWVEEQVENKGHELDWSITTFFDLLMRYKPLAVGVDANAYQRTLAREFKREIEKRRAFRTQVVEISDRRSKFHRITGALLPYARTGNFWVKRGLQLLVDQFLEYPGSQKDDHLESVALAIIAQQEALPWLSYQNAGEDNIYKQLENEERKMPSIEQGSYLCP